MACCSFRALTQGAVRSARWSVAARARRLLAPRVYIVSHVCLVEAQKLLLMRAAVSEHNYAWDLNDPMQQQMSDLPLRCSRWEDEYPDTELVGDVRNAEDSKDALRHPGHRQPRRVDRRLAS
jgi:hypothetical protein